MKSPIRAVLVFTFAAFFACNNPPTGTPDPIVNGDGGDGGFVPLTPTDGGTTDAGPVTPPVKNCGWGENANGQNCESGYVDFTYIKYSTRSFGNSFLGAASAISSDGKTIAFAGNGDSNTSALMGVFTLENNQWNSQTQFGSAVRSNPGPAKIVLSEEGDICVSILSRSAFVSTRIAGAWSSFQKVTNWEVSSVAISPNRERIALGLRDSNIVVIFRRSTNSWTEEARLHSPDFDDGAFFGSSLAFSSNGTTLFIGAQGEDGGSADPSDNSKKDSGAVFVFELKDNLWSQTAYLKAKEGKEGDQFGFSLSVSLDGKTLAVGANGEDSQGKESGAVYVFERSSDTEWAQKVVLKAPFPGENDNFGHAVALSGNGEFLIVGAPNEDSSAIRFNGNADNDDASNSGAAFLFRRTDGNWIPAGYVKAMNTEKDDLFGWSVAISKEGRHILMGAPLEDGSSIGVNGNLNDNKSTDSGAVFLYEWKSNSVSQ